MTKQEALNKIKELEEYVKNIEDNEVGYKDDEIFLLSAEEYEMYKDKIQHINIGWWLRSPVDDSKSCAIFVNYGGNSNDYGSIVYDNCVGIRPVLKVNKFNCTQDLILHHNYPFVKIDEGLYIAKVPIDFNKFDKKSNDYETSEIRRRLLEWDF